MDPELRDAVVGLLRSLRENPSERTWLKVLNAPFTLTIVGGVLLAIVSGTVAQCTANMTKEREQALELYRQKQAFVASFATNLEKYLELTWSLRKRGVFLKEWQNEPEKVRYTDGRTFDETRAKWEEDKRYWLEHSPGSPVGIISTARILFRQREVNAKLDGLAKGRRPIFTRNELQRLAKGI